MKPHLFLNNPRGESKTFNVARFIDEEDDKDETPEKPPEAYRYQKQSLNGNLSSLLSRRLERHEKRTIQIPEHIDYVFINFFAVFNNSEPFRTRTRFESEFGMVPVAYNNFNQSVLFAISDDNRFNHFIELLNQFINSEDNIHPNGQRYHILTLIESFAFLDFDNLRNIGGLISVVLHLVNPASAIVDKFSSILASLLELLNENAGENGVSFNTDFQTSIEIQNIPNTLLNSILSNYDIVQSIQSIRAPAIRSNAFNQPELSWNLTINPPLEKNVIIGVIDNGIRKISPLEKIIVDRRIDVTNKRRPNPLNADHPHGTMVAILAAIGDRFFNTTQNVFVADAMIMPIKILDAGTGNLNIYDIKEAIEKGIEAGVRIFNLSVCGPGKMYNEMHSDYAYILDKLTFEHDILIFIATGNLDEESIQAMQSTINGNPQEHFHSYPNHFYNPYELSIEHACESTNICIPAESMNNITVGALADNKMAASITNLTPFKELPAYYTRKWHLDYSRKINGRFITRKQTNHSICKPDIAMPGGDLLTEQGRMQVIGFGENGNDFYSREAGTSLSTPLASNLAAKIVSRYPDLTMQSVKALIINSSVQLISHDFLDDLILKVKNQTAQDYFGKPLSRLVGNEKVTINTHLKSDRLYDRLIGYGTPNQNRALYSDKKRVTVVIQDTITLNSHKVIQLNIPEYLLQYTRSGALLDFKATLCYKFRPVANNQLAYNPLHISFNIFRDIETDNPLETANIISNKNHSWYSSFIEGLEIEKEISKEKNKALAIKTNSKPWSEDFFPSSSKPYSNTQQFEIKMNKAEIIKASNQISVAVRCTHKRDLLPHIEEGLRKMAHDFSIVIEITEKENQELINYDLHEELQLINDLDIYPTQQLDLESDLDMEN